VLPGSKLREEETGVSAMERVVDEDLAAMGASVRWHPMVGRSQTSYFKHSPTHGLKTMYHRTVYTGFADAEQIGSYIPTPRDAFAPQFSTRATGTLSGWLRRSPGARVQAVQEHAASILRGIPDVAVCADEDGSAFYVWLVDEEFHALEGDDARPILEQWVREMVASSAYNL